MAALRERRWRGNVRELAGVVEELVLTSRSEIITAEDVRKATLWGPIEAARTMPALSTEFTLFDYLDAVRRDLIETAVRDTKGNQSAAARRLGMTPQNLGKQLKKYQIRAEKPPSE